MAMGWQWKYTRNHGLAPGGLVFRQVYGHCLWLEWPRFELPPTWKLHCWPLTPSSSLTLSSLILQDWYWPSGFQSHTVAWAALPTCTSFSRVDPAKEPPVLPAVETIITPFFSSLPETPVICNAARSAETGCSLQMDEVKIYYHQNTWRLQNGLMETINVLLSTIRWMADQCSILID